MKNSRRVRFFNFFRNLFRVFRLDHLFPFFTNDKGYKNIFVKCIPQNYQYPLYSFRKVKRDGVWFELDLSEYMEWVIYYGLIVENRKILYDLVKPKMILFDVGSNIGETMLNFAKLTGEEGRVFGFEPVPYTFEKCSRNLSFNNFKNVTVAQVALSDKAEVLFFNEPNNNNSGGVFMNKSKGEGNYEVEATTLDAFVDKLGIDRIDLIKIDVEGFEANVLKGAEQTCRKLRPKLFVEVDDLNLKKQGSSAVELLEMIVSYGYRYSKIDNAELKNHPVYHYDIYAEPIQ